MVPSIPTRNYAILEIVLSDISHLYHPPTTLPPLQVDEDKPGSDSDHNIVVFAPSLHYHWKSQIEIRRKLTYKKLTPTTLVTIQLTISNNDP